MTAAWLQELARYGIRVAGIAPGFSETRMVVRMKPKLREQFEQRIPLHRFVSCTKSHTRPFTSWRTTTSTAARWRSTAGCGCNYTAEATMNRRVKIAIIGAGGGGSFGAHARAPPH
jgi:hypothetical protein